MYYNTIMSPDNTLSEDAEAIIRARRSALGDESANNTQKAMEKATDDGLTVEPHNTGSIAWTTKSPK